MFLTIINLEVIRLLFSRPNEQVALDPLVLIDALAVIMGHEEKELCKPGHVALVLIIETATSLLGSKEMVRFKLFLVINQILYAMKEETIEV